MKVLVTGANGFLGRHAVAELLRRGHAVRALVRPAASISNLAWPKEVELFRADLRGSAKLVDAFDGIDALIHLAAQVTGGEDLQFAATVVGTEKLLDAMAKSQTKRLVLASSFSCYDWSAIRGTLDESSPVEPSKDLYARDGYAVAKVWQERVTQRMADENQWQLTILRPGFIWGPEHADLAGIGQRIGPIYCVFGPTRALPLSYVENTASAFVAAAEKQTEREATREGEAKREGEAPAEPSVHGEVASREGEAPAEPSDRRQNSVRQEPRSPFVINVLDPEPISAWRYAGTLKHRGPGSSRLRFPVPYWLAMTTTRLAQWTSRLIFHGKGKLPSILVPCRFEARFKPVRFSDQKLRTMLNWTAPISFEEALKRTHALRHTPFASDPSTRAAAAAS